METLVLGRPGLERTLLRRFLSDAGHEISLCHDRRWGCVGMDDACPLDAGNIDVSIACADAADRFDPQGIACVHRAGIALVTIGATPLDPVLQYATAAHDHIDEEVLASIERVGTDSTSEE